MVFDFCFKMFHVERRIMRMLRFGFKKRGCVSCGRRFHWYTTTRIANGVIWVCLYCGQPVYMASHLDKMEMRKAPPEGTLDVWKEKEI